MLKNDMNLILPFIILNNDETANGNNSLINIRYAHFSVKHGTNSRFDNISYIKTQKQRGVEEVDNGPALSLH